MPDQPAPDVTDRFTTAFIRRTARTLIADGFFEPGDLDDLVQELTLHLLEAVPCFDSERARWSTFVRAVVTRKAVSVGRQKTAERRRIETQIGSLGITVQDEDGLPVELGETISEDESILHVGVEESDRQTQMECAADVQEALAKLPPELRAVCEQAMVRSATAGARQLGIARTTFMARLAKAGEYIEIRRLVKYVQPAE